jgi:hypothetical protein
MRCPYFLAYKFKGPKSACLPCVLRSQCLRHPERTDIRQVAYFVGRSEKGRNTFTERMKRKIDSAVGRVLYSMRLGVSEPPFSHIRSAIGFDRFTLRGKIKVNTQRNRFCIVHNVKKIHRYGLEFVWCPWARERCLHNTNQKAAEQSNNIQLHNFIKVIIVGGRRKNWSVKLTAKKIWADRETTFP